MDATRILAIRHGETEWNVGARLQGHLDIGLNGTGRQQAQRLARALAARGEGIDAIYSSDLSRALDTARAVAVATGAPLDVRTALRERCFGDFQGHTYAELAQRLPEQAERWRRRDPHWAAPGGESLLAFQARVVQAVHALAAAHLGQHIALFTHGGVLDVLYRAATGLGLQDARTWQIGNAAINRLLWTPEGGLTLIGWADASHLEEETRDENTTA